jgi:nitronate monooxygenase
MSVSRRHFIRKTAAMTFAGAIGSSSERASGQGRSALNPRAEAFMRLFNLRYPIVGAPIAGPAAAIALTNSGAMGGIGMSFVSEPPDEIVKRVKAEARGSFFVNYVLNFEPRRFDEVLEAGAATVQFSWGMPSTEIVSKMRAAGARLGLQVTSRESAKAALDLGPDYLVCQGLQAGGHVQASMPLDNALEQVLEISGDTPVVASGGIATGGDLRRVISLGAAGAVMGTRLLATQESVARPDYKQALIKAEPEDTVYTICLTKTGWIANHRILRGRTFAMWEAAGCPKVGERPGEHDIVGSFPNGQEIERYSGVPPFVGIQGDVTDLAMYAGEGVGKISDVPTVAELVDRTWQEFQDDGG